MKISHIVKENYQQCPECGGPAFSDLVLAEKKDACYSKVRSRYKVWPSAYASGALVQCRKKGAANWGNRSKNESISENQEQLYRELWQTVANRELSEVDLSSVTDLAPILAAHLPRLASTVVQGALKRARTEVGQTVNMLKTIGKHLTDRPVSAREDKAMRDQFKDIVVYGMIGAGAYAAAIVAGPAAGAGVALAGAYKKELLDAIKEHGPDIIIKLLKRQGIDLVRDTVEALTKEFGHLAPTTAPADPDSAGRQAMSQMASQLTQPAQPTASAGSNAMSQMVSQLTRPPAVAEASANQQFVAAQFIDEFGDGDRWLVKGTPDLIRQFIVLANEIEQAAVTGTEYDPRTGTMGGIHSDMGNAEAPQWTEVEAADVDDIRPITAGVIDRLSRVDLQDPGDEFMSDFLLRLEEKGLAKIAAGMDNTQGMAEAGPFSYGAKRPRKGTVAHNAMMKRREQEKNRPPIEPKDQMVGTAKVTKGMAEGYKFKGPFPFDVDHMPGAVHRSGNKPTNPSSKKFFHDKTEWDQAVNQLNSAVFDDNSDFVSGHGVSEVRMNDYAWAKWSDKQNRGYIDMGSMTEQSVADKELTEEFDLIESVVNTLAMHNSVDADVIWEDLESLTDDELYVFAFTMPIMEDWQKANKRDRTDGMSRKAVNAYRREHPGSKLKTAVTTKPSKLKRGSKASKRRKSYCSRSRGQMKMHSISCAKTPDKAICKARRRWNCEGIDRTNEPMVAEMSRGSRSYDPFGDERAQQRQMDAERRAFKYQELQHELGHEDHPDFERRMRQQQMERDRGPWYIEIDGKLLKVGGEVKVFDWKRNANKYALAILERRPDLKGKIFLTKKGPDTEQDLKEFAPGSGSSSGRWYTDAQMVDQVGNGWDNEMDSGTHLTPAQQIADAQAWLEDQGYTVQVLDVKRQGSGNSWFIDGVLHRSESKQGIEENMLMGASDPVIVITDKATGKYLDKLPLSAATAKYRLGMPDAVKKQLQSQDYTTIGKYTISAPMTGQPQGQDIAEDTLARLKTLAGTSR